MRKATKLCTAALLTATMLITTFTNFKINTPAAEQTLSYDKVLLFQEGEFPSETGMADSLLDHRIRTAALSETETVSNAEQAIYQGMLNCESSISLESFQLNAAQLKTYFEYVVNSSPELFYVASGYSYYMTADGSISSLLPQYTSSGAELTEKKNFYDSQMAMIIDQVDPSWSDYEKILYVHDYLASNYEYDNSYTIRNAYDFFVQKTGVCQAYTMVFCGLMKELGIETSTALSEEMNHIWNLVKLNNQWYHVDVTWDDPVPDNPGMAYHKNFLLSDAAIGQPADGSSPHYAWTAKYTCTDTTYDQDFTRTVITPFQYLNGKWFYADFDASQQNSFLYSYNFDSQQKDMVHSLEKWTTGNNGYYTACFSGLASYNHKLYFNSASDIYCYDPADNSTSIVATPSISESIYGLRIQEQTLTYYTADSPSSAYTAYNLTLDSPIITEPPVDTPEPLPSDTPQPGNPALGDIDHSGSIDLTDAQLALKVALKITTLSEADLMLADVNQNNTVDLSDAQLILKYALKIITSF